MLKTRTITTVIGIVLLLTACSSNKNAHAHSVYLLIDTSGTYTQQLKKAQQLIRYVLFELQPGDFFAVARIDSESFDEKDIIAKLRFDDTRTRANEQKKNVKKQLDKFIKTVQRSKYTDITGGIIQAVQYLQETAAGSQTLLIFSDLKEDLKPGYKRNFPVNMQNIKVIAINVTKLRKDNIDPRKYLNRVAKWKNKVESGGGKWRMINDLENIDELLSIL